jgi:DNA repair protein RecO
MSIEKTASVILSVLPYRESSFITNLFTSEYGRISGIAKGIRRNTKQSVPFERGFLIEHVIYLKPNRELQILSDIRIGNFFPCIRGNLEKTTLRDIAFEILLSSVTLSEPHPELFELLSRFLFSLDEARGIHEEQFSILWKFIFDFTAMMGLGVDFGRCFKCGSLDIVADGGFLMTQKGAMICRRCAPQFSPSGWIPSEIVSYLLSGHFPSGPSRISFPELLRLTRLAVYYCRFHLDIRKELRSLDFLQQMG